MAVLVIVGYAAWEIFGEAPQGMVTLVGLAGGALFGAVSDDSKKRRRDNERMEQAEATADRAETKADRLVEVAEQERPDTTHSTGLPEPKRDEGPQ